MSAITAKASRKMKKYAVLTREPRCFLGSFDFSWEQRKVSELFRVTRGYVLAATQTETEKTDEKPYPVYSSQTKDKGLMGYYKDYLYEDAITWTTDGANAGTVNYRAGKFYCTNVCGVLLSNEVKANQMIAEALNNVAKGYVSYVGNPKLMNNVMADIVIQIPTHAEEREQLSSFFANLDNLITLHQRKCANLCSPSQVVFSLLFATSTFSWEQRKFGEVFDCTVPNNTLSRAELSYDEGTVLNVHYGDVLIKYGSVLDVQKDDIPRIPHRCIEDFNGALLQDGDVIIADTAEDETTGKACEIGNLQGSTIVSGLHTIVCRPRNRMALGYLGYYLNSNAYHHQLLPLMQGIKVLSLSRSNIQKTSVSYPSAMKEQQLIASYFSQLDHLITLHQRECISFTGRADRLILTANKKRTTSSWEQRKLGELCNITTGKLDANAMVSDGQYDFYTSGIDVFKIDVAAFEGPAITIAGNGASVGYMHLADGKFNAYQRTYVLTDFLADRQFLNVAIGNELPNKIQEEVRGSGIPYIVLNMLTDLAIPFPSHEEQYAIGVYFQQLDNLITLHQRKPFLMKWRTSDANRNQTNRLVL